MLNSGFNILVVEDDPLVLSGTVRILKKAGYTVTKAVTGAGALRTAKENPPDLILLDVVLPDINGFEVCRTLKKDEATRDIFIAIVSGHKISPEDQAQGLDLGADEYILRPIGNRELLARVKALQRLKQTELDLAQSLEESRDQYRSVINTMMDSVAIVDGQGKIVFVNPAFCRLYKYDEQEVIGKSTLELIDPAFHHVFRQFVSDLNTRGCFSGQTLDIKKDGTRFHTDVTGSKINFQGRACYLALIRDITKQKRYESKISHAADEWQSTFDATNDVIWIIDRDKKIVRSNKIAEAVFGKPLNAIAGRHCWEVVHGTDRPSEDCPFDKAMLSCKRESYEVQINETWFEVTVDPILDDRGVFLKAVHIIKDITERKTAEQERENLIKQLRKALDEIKVLKGIVPICSHCKKIRDDKGYWNQLEAYIEAYSDASFSHALCPECSDKLYGDEDWYVDMKRKDSF